VPDLFCLATLNMCINLFLRVQVLKRGELAALFSLDQGWQVWLDEEVRLPCGRPLNCFLARRTTPTQQAM
jgi:hypothetical protein